MNIKLETLLYNYSATKLLKKTDYFDKIVFQPKKCYKIHSRNKNRIRDGLEKSQTCFKK